MQLLPTGRHVFENIRKEKLLYVDKFKNLRIDSTKKHGKPAVVVIYEYNNMKVIPILYQSGYLTIKDYVKGVEN